jgi:hypothetical protein
MFSPKPDYYITSKPTHIKDFFEYAEAYVVRPPYQRKNVWTNKKQQDLMDSLLRRYYVPRIVIREVRLSQTEIRKEVIDGQQRIHTVQRFFANALALPPSVADLSPELPGKRYSDLPVGIREFIDKEITFDVDTVGGIDDPFNPEHQALAAQVFWRLQQGESLNFMEVAHSRLSSLARNFVVKYADDISFDYGAYKPLDTNPDMHAFFTLLYRSNERMQNLMLLTRLLMVEWADGPAELKDTEVSAFIDQWQCNDGINNLEMENLPEAKRLLACLNDFYAVFKSDPMMLDGSGLRELQREYFIVSFVMLLRHLKKHYAVEAKHRSAFHDFLLGFHGRWADSGNEETEILMFKDSRQQGKADIEVRDRVLRELFFRHLDEMGIEIHPKDDKRAFSEAERIRIYRRDRGLCQACLQDGRPEKEALVPWSQYEADHVLPHSHGGMTIIENGQVLCSVHNKLKGADVA